MAILGQGGSCYYNASTPNAPNCEASKSITLKLYLINLTGTQAFFNATNGGVSLAYQLGVHQTPAALTLWNFGGGVVVGYTPTLLNTWLNICYTYDSTTTTSTLYENGVSKATSTVAVLTGAVNTCQIVGNQWNEPPVSGVLMEDVRLYNRVLSLTEITSIANANGQDNIEYGLLYNWRMNEGQTGLALAATDFKEVCSNASSTLVGTAPFPISTNTANTNRRPIAC